MTSVVKQENSNFERVVICVSARYSNSIVLSVSGDHEEELNVRLDIGSVLGGEIREEPS
jgi:hypothetical protein